jgi:hypothetical protein
LTIDNLYEFAGAIGIEPLRLFSYNLRQFFSIVRGFRRQKAIEENNWRKIYGLLVMINRDPKKPTPNILTHWSIPELDSVYLEDEGEDEEDKTDIKENLLKVWKLK